MPKSTATVNPIAPADAGGRGVPAPASVPAPKSRMGRPPKLTTPAPQPAPEEEDQEASLSEMMEGVVVKTKNGFPDMRIKENRQAFLFDTKARVDGTPDQRKYINRPDLQELRRRRRTDKPNLIFTPEGELR